MKRVLVIILLGLAAVVVKAQGSNEPYPFPTNEQRAQFQTLLKELRCLVCQNQDLADSNASLAVDLKKLIYQQVLAHHTNDEIKAFLVERYGDFILFNPPLKAETYLLWFGPFGMLFIGLLIILRWVRRENTA